MATGLRQLGCHPEPDGRLVRHHGVARKERGVVDENAGIPQEDRAEVAVVVIPRELDRSTSMVRLPRCASAIEALPGARIATRTVLCASARAAIHFLLEAVAPSLRAAWCCGPTASGLVGGLRQESRQFSPILVDITTAGKPRESRGGL